MPQIQPIQGGAEFIYRIAREGQEFAERVLQNAPGRGEGVQVALRRQEEERGPAPAQQVVQGQREEGRGTRIDITV